MIDEQEMKKFTQMQCENHKKKMKKKTQRSIQLKNRGSRTKQKWNVEFAIASEKSRRKRSKKMNNKEGATEND